MKHNKFLPSCTKQLLIYAKDVKMYRELVIPLGWIIVLWKYSMRLKGPRGHSTEIINHFLAQ